MRVQKPIRLSPNKKKMSGKKVARNKIERICSKVPRLLFLHPSWAPLLNNDFSLPLPPVSRSLTIIPLPNLSFLIFLSLSSLKRVLKAMRNVLRATSLPISSESLPCVLLTSDLSYYLLLGNKQAIKSVPPVGCRVFQQPSINNQSLSLSQFFSMYFLF